MFYFKIKYRYKYYKETYVHNTKAKYMFALLFVWQQTFLSFLAEPAIVDLRSIVLSEIKMTGIIARFATETKTLNYAPRTLINFWNKRFITANLRTLTSIWLWSYKGDLCPFSYRFHQIMFHKLVKLKI